MFISKYKKQVAETIIAPMLAFIDGDEEPAYSKADVQQCEALLDTYLNALNTINHPTDSEIMEQVRQIVLALNDLNEATDYCLIETNEREALWEVIQTSAIEAGLQNADEDITAEWRDW